MRGGANAACTLSAIWPAIRSVICSCSGVNGSVAFSPLGQLARARLRVNGRRLVRRRARYCGLRLRAGLRCGESNRQIRQFRGGGLLAAGLRGLQMPAIET